MKKITLLACSTMAFFMFSCQKDNVQEDGGKATSSKKEAWLGATLNANFAASQKQVTAYLFSSEELTTLISASDLHHLRFVLGYNNGIIQIDAVGVSSKGKETGRIVSKALIVSSFTDQLAVLNQFVPNTNKKNVILNKHLLSSKAAYDGIEAWQNKLSKAESLDEITSYDDLRIQSYKVETVVIKDMLDKSGTANVGLFLGLNNEGKMTTVFVALDKDNAIKKSSPTSKTSEEIYDFTEPSPPCTADPEIN